MSSEMFELDGRLNVVLRDEDGNVKQEQEHFNTITATGKNQIAEQLLASPGASTKPTHMAVGTGTATATALQTETDRNALTTKTRSTNVVTMVGDWAAGDATATLTEAGIFDAASAGNCLATTTLSPSVVKGASDTLSITWTWTIG